MPPDTIRVLLAAGEGALPKRLHTLLEAAPTGALSVLRQEGALRLVLARADIDCIVTSHQGTLPVLGRRIEAAQVGWIHIAARDSDAIQAARLGAQVCLLEAELTAEALCRSVRLAWAREQRRRHRRARTQLALLQPTAALSALLHDQLATPLQWATRCIAAALEGEPPSLDRGMLSGAHTRLEESRSALLALRQLRLLRPGSVEARSLSRLAEQACQRVRLPDGVVVFRELAPLPEVAVDVAQLQHALACLIQNGAEAVAHSPPGQRRVLVRSWSGEGWVGVLVFDRGAGVPEGLQRRIFAPLYSTKGQPGAGMGLWVASLVAARHQGEVRLLPGRDGTCFALLLPTETGLMVPSVTDIQLVERAPAGPPQVLERE